MANEFIARKGLISSGSVNVSGSVTANQFFGTASLASLVQGGKSRYIPMWTGSGANELTSSIMYQMPKGIFIGYDTNPHVHSAEGETLAVHSGETGVKNVIYAHGTSDDSYRINIRNVSSGVSASTNIIATADTGNDEGGYVRMGINSSTYSRDDEIGGPLDAYLFTTGSDLLIGNLSPDKRIILFTGPGDADSNARVYIDPSGSVSINTIELDPSAPDALRVRSVPFTTTYNVITAIGEVNDYAQINMKNTGSGDSVSSDIVATANNGDENTNFVNMGINGGTYVGTIGGPNDAYLYNTGGHLHIGVVDPNEEIMFFVGSEDVMMTTKLTLRDNNQHVLSGSLDVTGSLNVLDNVINNLTASHAMTASYVAGAASDWNTLTNKPDGLVSNSAQYPGWVTASSQVVLNAITGTSFSNNAFYFPNNLRVEGTFTAQQINTEFVSSSIIYESGSSKFGDTFDDVMSVTGSIRVLGGNISGSFIGLISESTQVNYAQLQNIPIDIVSSSAQVKILLPDGTVSSSLQYPGWVTASTQIDYNQIQNKLSGVISSSTQFNALINTSASFATTASAATSITFTPATASFATSASYAPTILPTDTVSSSTQIDYTQIQNKPNTIPTASYVEFTNVGNKPELVSSSAQISYTGLSNIPLNIISSSTQFNALINTSASFATTASAATSITFTPTTSSFAITSSYAETASYALATPPTFIDNFVTVGLPGSDTQFNSIKSAVDSITDASANNTYTVKVYPGLYIEDTITLKPYIAIKGESSTSTIVSASNPNNSIFIMADQTMVIDMGIQGSTGPTASAVVYSSPTTPQTNAIAYVENVRFGTNYTNAKVVGSGSNGNCILQCSNVKYGGFTSGSKSFDVGFYVTSGSDGGIGRMQLRNVTSTNGGVAGTDNDQIFALADAPGCTFIVNGCLLTRATGVARGTGFKVYNGGQLRLTGVNFQRWIRGIWAPQTGSAPSIDAIALNFENCTTDVAIEHSGSLGKVQGTDTFLKTQINFSSSLYEVGKDARRIRVAKKGGDFTSISASVAYITDSAANNRYVIEVGPGQYTEKTIDLTGKPYVSIVGSNIQTTQIFPSASNQHIIKMGVNNEISFLSLANAGPGYAAVYVDDIGDFAQAHKISIYDSDIGVQVLSRTQDTQFFGEYIDINGTFSYGTYVSASNNASCTVNVENYYLFPVGVAVTGNYVTHPSASLSLHTCTFQGDNTPGAVAIQMESGAEVEGTGLDIQDWDCGIKIPNIGDGPNFRMVGTMIHGSSLHDMDILNPTARGRYQGVSDHTLINNVSEDIYWNFLDDTDGENDITRKLSVTFADGTHTDATTLIFKGSPLGVMQGGVITTGSGFGIVAASGFGYLQDATNTDVFKRLDWIDGNLTLTANSNNYIYITDDGTLTNASSIPNNETNIILGRVVTNNTGIEFIDQTPYNGEHMANKLSTFNREALGPVYAAGSTVTENVTPFKLNVTAGTYFFSENKFTPAGTSSINLTQYYPSASTWARYTSSIVPSMEYASGGQLVAMTSASYTKHTLYGVGDGVDEKYFLVINSSEYSTLVAAENANLPSIPSYFNDGVVPLAAIYVQSGSANITQIQDIRPIIGFRAAGVNASSVHGNLLGLNADDHPQYLLVNGSRAMVGNLSLGGNNITNVGTMFGTASLATSASFATTASAATSITFTPATASFATTASAATSITFIPPTASFATTSSFATTASFAPYGGLRTKAGSVANTSFAGNPRKATVTFTTAFPNTNYAVTITGEDARSWTIESKAVGSFVISANSNTNLAGTTYWIATAYGET